MYTELHNTQTHAHNLKFWVAFKPEIKALHTSTVDWGFQSGH